MQLPPNFKTQFTRDELVQAGLSSTFSDFVLLPSKPRLFRSVIEERAHGWPAFFPQDVTSAYCLWTTNSDPTVFWDRSGTKEFVRLHHDDTNVQLLSSSEQGMLARLFLGLAERIRWKDERADRKELAEGAQLAGFRFLDPLLELYLRSGEDPDYSTKMQGLLANIDEGRAS